MAQRVTGNTNGGKWKNGQRLAERASRSSPCCLPLCLPLCQPQGALQRRFRRGIVRLPLEGFLELRGRIGVPPVLRQGYSVIKPRLGRVRLQAHRLRKLGGGLG